MPLQLYSPYHRYRLFFLLFILFSVCSVFSSSSTSSYAFFAPIIIPAYILRLRNQAFPPWLARTWRHITRITLSRIGLKTIAKDLLRFNGSSIERPSKRGLHDPKLLSGTWTRTWLTLSKNLLSTPFFGACSLFLPERAYISVTTWLFCGETTSSTKVDWLNLRIDLGGSLWTVTDPNAFVA